MAGTALAGMGDELLPEPKPWEPRPGPGAPLL